jgi:putative ABC transport system permease protein
VADGRPDTVHAVETALREELGRPISPIVSHEEDLGGRFVSERVNAMALNTFAAFALLLAAIGVYGSVAYAVTRRTREIGIRMALGAERQTVLALFARRAVVITALGATLGLGGSLVLTRVLQSFVSATSVTDPRVFVAAALMLVATSLLATYLPARRATVVDPTIALRSE